MRKDEAEKRRREVQEYFNERGWIWEPAIVNRPKQKYFRYGPVELLKPCVTMYHS